MVSLRHTPRRGLREDRYLDAARECLLTAGWRRTTLTDVARRADVSRMTIYRTWPDMESLLGDLMTREWTRLVADIAAADEGQPPLERLTAGIVRTVRALREDDLLLRIVEVDPEMLLPYLLHRRGRSQDHILSVVEPLLAAGQRDGSVRDGDPVLQARTLLLATQGFVLSTQTMTDRQRTERHYDDQLRELVRRFLSP